MPNWPEVWRCVDSPGVTHGMDPGGNGPSKGGERGPQVLEDLFEGRVMGYRRQIGRPLESRKSCSRLSPYLAGDASACGRCIKHIERLKCRGPKWTSRRLAADCAGRDTLSKFESECRIEFESVNKGYADFNGTPIPSKRKLGQTGIPLIDACMRCVTETGYLNFACAPCWLVFDAPPRPSCKRREHLARCFLDFEPGIHFSQFPRAGVTGINTIRIYNPVKQGLGAIRTDCSSKSGCRNWLTCQSNPSTHRGPSHRWNALEWGWNRPIQNLLCRWRPRVALPVKNSGSSSAAGRCAKKPRASSGSTWSSPLIDCCIFAT